MPRLPRSLPCHATTCPAVELPPARLPPPMAPTMRVDHDTTNPGLDKVRGTGRERESRDPLRRHFLSNPEKRREEDADGSLVCSPREGGESTLGVNSPRSECVCGYGVDSPSVCGSAQGSKLSNTGEDMVTRSTPVLDNLVNNGGRI